MTPHETSPTAHDDTSVAPDPQVPRAARDVSGQTCGAPRAVDGQATAAAGEPAATEHVLPPIVDWGRTARRLRRQLLIVAVGIVVVWLVVGLARGSLTVALLGEIAGFGVLVGIALEIFIVGGAALRGMLLAGERGERLAGSDVSLLPPQVTCRMRRRG